MTVDQVMKFITQIRSSLIDRGYLNKSGKMAKGVNLYSEVAFKAKSMVENTNSSSLEKYDLFGCVDLIAIRIIK